MSEGRIWFPQSPWPRGHAVKEFRWSGRLEDDGTLWFDLHLETADYDTEGAAEEDGEGSWRSSTVWLNYYSCTLSSTAWKEEGSTGLLVGRVGSPLNWAMLAGTSFVTDQGSEGEETDPDRVPAFRIYLLGHDAVADHRVTFRPDGAGVDVEWTGRIALAYGGDFVLRHTFRAAVRGAAFDGFGVPDGTDDAKVRELLAAACVGADRFEPREAPDGRRLWLPT